MGKTSIAGHWVSAAVETRTGGDGSPMYLRRDFTNTDDFAEASFTFYEDPDGTRPGVTVKMSGHYRLGDECAAVPGAYEGEFDFETMTVTPHNAFFADLFNGAAPGTCGNSPWQVGVEQDVSETGCAPLGLDIKASPREYDIVKLNGDNLHYGARPADGGLLDKPERRPTALQIPLTRAA